MPAQSPTLSPTLSAITAGLRGSSSGIPASTLPTRSAPTSAPLVKIPPPRRAKMEISEPPKPSPTSGWMRWARSPLFAALEYRNQKKPATPSRPRPTTNIPVIAPPRNATSSACCRPVRAASAVRTLARTEMFIPMMPERPESTAPMRKPHAVVQPSCGTNPIAKNRIAPTSAMVLYWRQRYATAPCCTAAHISRMRSLPVGCFRIQDIRQPP